MCGRFTLRTPAAELADVFRLLRTPDLRPRYNIAPSQSIAVVRPAGGARELAMLHWGLVPSWSKDRRMSAAMINARSETAATKPAFRSAFRRRRCLIPADGFYEWRKTEGRTKQPYYITLRDERPFAFAGLWEHWEGANSSAVESCTILTTEANALLRGLHDRMPVILHGDDYDRWLDPDLADAKPLESLLTPYESDAMQFRPVSTLVNSPRNDTPDCIGPADRPRSLIEE